MLRTLIKFAVLCSLLFPLPVSAAWRLTRTIDLPAEPWRFTFSPDGIHLAVAYKTGIVEIRNFKTFQIVHRFQAHESPIGSLHYARSGDWLFTVARTGKVWSTGDWSKVAKVPYVKFNGNFTPDGRWVVGLDGDRQVMIWDYMSGGVVADLDMKGGTRYIQIQFTEDGKYLLLNPDSGWSKILDLTSGAVIDGDSFAKKRNRSRLRIENTSENTVKLSLGPQTDDNAPILQVEPGRTKPLAALVRAWQSNRWLVDVVDLATKRRLTRLKSKERVTGISFSNDDSLIAIQRSKTTVWRIKRKKKIASLEGSGRVVFSNQSYDLLVADGPSLRVYSPDR